MLQNIFMKQIFTSSEMVLNNLLSFMFFSFSTYSNNFLLRFSNTFFVIINKENEIKYAYVQQHRRFLFLSKIFYKFSTNFQFVS